MLFRPYRNYQLDVHLKFKYVVSIRGAEAPLLNHRLEENLSIAWMYILECCDGSYYVGSTKDLKLRFLQHQAGKGSVYTSGRLPLQLVYCEEYDRIADAFYREKQVQGWTRRKREALIHGTPELLPALAKKIFDRKNIDEITIVLAQNGG